MKHKPRQPLLMTIGQEILGFNQNVGRNRKQIQEINQRSFGDEQPIYRRIAEASLPKLKTVLDSLERISLEARHAIADLRDENVTIAEINIVVANKITELLESNPKALEMANKVVGPICIAPLIIGSIIVQAQKPDYNDFDSEPN